MRSGMAASILVLVGAGWTPPGEELKPDRFEKVRGIIKPGVGFLEDIPWVPTLWEARQKAAVEGKPLYVMSGGGPPLGAT
jgi:hypothetical protein